MTTEPLAANPAFIPELARQGTWYVQLGWTILEERNHHGAPITIMTKEL